MSMSSIRMPAGGGAESRAPALRALLHWAGGDAGDRELNAVLGASFMVSVRDPTHCPATWMTGGSAVFLVEAAACFGVRLRGLHPPEAAVGLEHAPEFAQHFEASYRPLIERALDHDQPVLARGGWGVGKDAAGNHSGRWGIVTGRDVSGFCGVASGPNAGTVPLGRPCVEVYIVEEIDPRSPGDAELLRLAVRHARVALSNGVDARFGLTTGPAVYEAWLERLLGGPACAVCGDCGTLCHRRLACAIVEARRSGGDFLDQCRGCVPGGARSIVDNVIAACHGLAQALAAFDDVEVVRATFADAGGCSTLGDAVTLARDHETRIRQEVSALSDAIGA